jgi:putative membrane protein
MANERTALAWVRTGLALIAGGIALTSVAAVAELPTFLDVVAIFSCLFGAVTAVIALIEWQRNERAMRLGEPLPSPIALRWLVLVVVLAALVLAGYAVSQT